MTAARSGPAAFTAFYRQFERSLLGFFVRATGRPDLAADLTAETFARALESVAAYDPSRGRPDQWLFGIARNVLAASYRQGRVEAAARERLGLPKLILDDHALEAITRLSAGRDQATLGRSSRSWKEICTTRRASGYLELVKAIPRHRRAPRVGGA